MNRRYFISTTVLAGAALSFKIPAYGKQPAIRKGKSVRIGIITDLHHDIMPDGIQRLNSFVKQMEKIKPDAIMQMGDFAYPASKNQEVTDIFNAAHRTRMHVIGNHDTDAGHTKAECISTWAMPSAYYAQNIGGIWFIILDGNDKGSPANKGGYPSYIGPEQVSWLKDKLNEINGPIIIVSHQPLAGEDAVDNAEEIQEILGKASDKILLAINGHTHVNCILRKKDVSYLHINSASYYWVGDQYTHETYSAEIVKQHPFVNRICPYKDALFTMMTIDVDTLDIAINGMSTDWVGKNPAVLGYSGMESLTIGEEIAPKINSREILKVKRA
jgi:calcineurin-like phosphoesterase family protein